MYLWTYSSDLCCVWSFKWPKALYHWTSLLGYDMSIYIRRYSRYLTERALSYRLVAADFTKMKRGWGVCSGEIFLNEPNKTNGSITAERTAACEGVQLWSHLSVLTMCNLTPLICSAQDGWSDAQYEHRKADEDSTYHSESAGRPSGLWGTGYKISQIPKPKFCVNNQIKLMIFIGIIISHLLFHLGSWL